MDFKDPENINKLMSIINDSGLDIKTVIDKLNESNNNFSIIYKEGRKPYVPIEQSDNVPEEYVSVQKFINNHNNKIDPKRLNVYLETLIKRNFYKIESNKFNIDVKPGTRMCYITNDFKWRSGGWLVDIKRNIDNDKLYILYKGFGGKIISLQVEDVMEFWLKDKEPVKKKSKKKNLEKKSIYDNPGLKTNFPIIVKDDLGQDVVLVYCRDNDKKRKVLESKKFKNISENGWMFNDFTQGFPLNEINLHDETLSQHNDNKINLHDETLSQHISRSKSRSRSRR